MTELGAAIHEYRIAKGWLQDELGAAVCLSRSAISRFESGDRIPHRDTARQLDEALGAGGRIWRLRDELDDNPDATLIQKVFKNETKAIKIRETNCAVPALLQNPEYERAIIQKHLPYFGGNLEEKLKHRVRRHELFKRSSAPPFSTVLTEAALRSIVGNQSVMRRQLVDLIAVSQRSGIDIRIAPFSGNADVVHLAGEFSITDLPDGKTVVHARSGALGFLVTKPETVNKYITLHNLMQANALDSEESRDLIHKTVREHYPCLPVNLTGP
ncbi:helix-turn-helix transcriptional regulator [Streptomyces sp. UNOC14_S4]|uniref:helix-turn-helix domain-containing protein n=1 Tax=Streptomyces sp. UNOC14_S4 TaxID=2872340 RepID=UPI001E5D662F|nr:helix-turn-helix transcriptional regulator [Streptomyces sp. UNOC14_S4]MCC3772252.1 helix-turn-helix transcriptional regulator [Streptomyces sp. UNOC14_S4]